nr:MAG TPA: hypothetical protein [Caudoviricetes sp.]
MEPGARRLCEGRCRACICGPERRRGHLHYR